MTDAACAVRPRPSAPHLPPLKLEAVELRLERVRLLLERLHGHVHFDGHIDVVLRDLLDLTDGAADLLCAQGLLRGGTGDLRGLPRDRFDGARDLLAARGLLLRRGPHLPRDVPHPLRRLDYPFAP